MGVDRPGDMDYLVSIARPDISVITNIGLSHYQYFKEAGKLENEKGKLAEALPSNGILIVNADNKSAFEQKRKTKAKILSYGIIKPADINFLNVKEDLSQPLAGVSTNFSVKTPTQSFAAITRTLGLPHLSSLCAAVSVAEALKMDKELIIKGIKEYKPTPGRLNVISGIKRTVIIDDTYNAAPDSTRAALGLLAKFPGNNKVAVLGDMLELGALSETEHQKIGALVSEMKIQKFITIGPEGKIMAAAAAQNGMDKNKILSFDASTQSLNAVQNLLEPGSIILIKGSQGMRMEKITKEIMAEPMRAEELLCRQYGKWVEV